MDIHLDKKPHKTTTNTNTNTTTTSDLFICFTSRLSNSSMRLTSKSILSHNGSLRKCPKSPAMYPTENPEPSSPKVTCIGQVRVKTKKQGKKIKMLACKTKHSNQKWVHLPFSICESLKGFGTDFSCLIPCKSACFSGTGSGTGSASGSASGGGGGGEKGSSCGGVFRWMVSLHEGERRDIELVVNGDEEELMEERVLVMERECSRRRSIFDDMEFDDLFGGGDVEVGGNDNDDDNGDGGGDGVGGVEGGRGRVSLSVPPKNALLLMRCRSDPMRMASLSRKFWDPPLVQHVDDGDGDGDGDGEVDEEEVVVIKDVNVVEDERLEVKESEVIEVKDGNVVEDEKLEVNEDGVIDIKEGSVELEDVNEVIDEMCEDLDVVGLNVEELLSSSEKLEEQLVEKDDDLQENIEDEQNIENRVIEEKLIEGLDVVDGCTIEGEEKVEKSEGGQDLVNRSKDEEMEESPMLFTSSSTSCVSSLEESTGESKEFDQSQEKDIVVQGQGESRKSVDKERNKSMLPDCLLLMMCEPKLSMEVSKETWICGTDFARWLPERHQNKKANKPEGGDKKTKAAAVAALPPLPPSAQGDRSGIQPGRSSISFPASGVVVANLIEQKLAKAGIGGFEPIVLTRCKSAPMRSADTFEPHRPATCGVGVARVGF